MKGVVRSVVGERPVSAGLIRLMLVWVALLGMSVQAAASQFEAGTPHALVEQVTEDVLQLVGDNKALLEDNPQAFYAAIGEVLNPVVAFDYIANGVMGTYARQASPGQRARFSEKFQTNLINTYAKGMAVYGQQKVVVVPPDSPVGDQRKVGVTQKVQAEDGEHTVVYTLGKSQADNQWKLLNVTINGINLGKTFRSQFDQAMKKSGDLDEVINSWSANG